MVFICLGTLEITAQTSGERIPHSDKKTFWNDLTILVDFAAAHHDKRTPSRKKRPPSIFDLPFEAEDRWSPWQFAISARKPVLEWENMRLEAGLGYSLEYQSYLRQVNGCFHLPKGTPCPYIAVHSDYYKIHLAQVPVRLSLPLTKHLVADLNLLPQFDIYKIVRAPSGKLIGEKFTMDFYSFEINPGFRIQDGRIGLGMNYRLYQIKKIDRVLFHPNKKKLEDYNPLKFWFSVSYRIGTGIKE